jgi:cytochrome c oxidase cbb3-type subunit 3
MFRVVHKIKCKKVKNLLLLAVALFGTVSSALADGPPVESSIGNPAVIILLIVIVILMIAIGLLSNVLLGSAEYVLEKEKEEDAKSSSTPAVIITGFLMLISASSFAQEAVSAATAPVQYIKGLSNTAFYSMIGVIALELIVILFMALQVKSLLTRKRTVVIPDADLVPVIARQKKGIKELWSRMNSFRPIEEEAALELHHDYDGIRELDNRLPPWWIYGFYVTIIFAGVYLWRYHVAYSAPSSTEEFQIAMKEAEVEKAAYLKKSANNVDENTVTLSSDPAIIESGKKTFLSSCAACHGTEGQGTVGPNLTDEYWLHGGSVSSIFKSIKYGWPEKGMKSWKDDFSPVQISQLSSFIKSLHGTKPANGKEPQGTIDNEPANPVDSTAKPIAVN